MSLNGVMAVILRYFAEYGSFGANYVKWVKGGPILSAMQANNLLFGSMCFMAISSEKN